MLRRLVVLTSLFAIGCPGSKSPEVPVGAISVEIVREGSALRGVATDPDGIYTAHAGLAVSPLSQLQFLRHDRTSARKDWGLAIGGTVGQLSRNGDLLAFAIVSTGQVVTATTPLIDLRGSPGSVLVGVRASTGAIEWMLPIDASEWSVITSLAPLEDGVLVGGTFSGTLRAADKIVSSAGKLDGFVARVDGTGRARWLIRVGGANADAVTGVAAAGSRVAITGTFATGAELQGEPLVATDDKSPSTDVFVAELDGKGARVWSATFGGPRDDSSAGVAIDGRGRLAVAATVREHLKVDVLDYAVRGPSDGVLVYYDRKGSPGPAIPLGGDALDGLHAITAAGERIVVGGFYAGSMRIGTQTISASGDDAFLASFDGARVTGVWAVAGDGREEIVALAPVPGGFVAGIGHTAAAKFDGRVLASPKDPASGAGVVVRGVR